MTKTVQVTAALQQGVCKACRRPCVGRITPLDCERRDCAWGEGTPEEKARAAIEAMREPTEAMTDAASGRAASCVHDAYGAFVTNHDASHIWSVMIDAAIAEVPA